MANTGRPNSEHPRLNRITVRFSDDEYQLLKEYANSHNLNMTQVIKLGVEYLLKNSK